MEHLILLTNHFPFGDGEEFIENEFTYLSKEFNKITIISSTTNQNQTREVNSKVSLLLYNPQSSFFEKLMIPILCLKNFKQMSFFVKNELRVIKSINKKMKFRLFNKIIHDFIKGLQYYKFLEENIGDFEDGKLFYSYWLSTQATALMFAKKKNPKIKAISRGHSIDIYPFRHKLGYIPFEKQKVELLDKIFFVSKHGVDYYEKFFKYNTGNIILAPLGTKRPIETGKLNKSKDQFILLSCSNIVSVKRLDLIVETLALIDSIQLKWIHIGDGELYDIIVNLAKKKLGKKENIDFQLLGKIQNTEVHKFLATNQIDLFINVSEIEAIPVTIREAMSYSIPCVATNVGGNTEIVNDANGFILKGNPEPDEIALVLQKYFLLTPEIKKKYKENAYITWENIFSENVVYPSFIEEIRRIYLGSKLI